MILRALGLALAALGLFVLALAARAMIAEAAPPPNFDPALAPWFRSLVQPDTKVPCCSEADCRTTEYRAAGGRFEVLIDARYGANVQAHWIAVPPGKIIRDAGNPTGSAVACWTPATGVLCFVLPPLI